MTVILVTTSNNAVREYLERRNDISLHTVECSVGYTTIGLRLAEAARNFPPDIIITYRCPYVVPSEVFSRARIGAYNIHPSLLPAYAGLNPWEEILKNRKTAGGVSLHKITEDVDGGPIIFKRAFFIEQNDNLETARNKADAVAAELTAQLFELIELKNNRL